MRLSLTWLQDFIEFTDGDPQRIADAITSHTAEVDAVEHLGSMLQNCCVGQVVSVAKHPNADRLSLCDVHTDRGEKRVVCGGTNLREGMRVAFAHVGATVLWHGEDTMTLEPVKIRGEASEGMICAAEELGLHKVFPEATGTNIIDLGDGDDAVGTSLQDYLGLDDVVLHIDNHSITHRPDLFSHVGFARECVAMGIATWKQKPEYTAPTFPADPLPFTISTKDESLVPRYACCVLEIDDLGETPAFMKTRLAAADWRSINLPVDITNFVSTEVGMPLHSFDLDDLQGDIVMRTTKKGESITTLDEEERELPAGALVMSDKKGIFDLLGIMGGLRSSTKPGTRRILLHSAAVDPVRIRNTVIATGHRTEAATVYEKGIAPVVVEQGFYRALELFLEHVPGARIVSAMESWGDDGQTSAIVLSAQRVRDMLGVDVPTEEMVRILRALECAVDISDDTLTVTPPLHRIGDLTEAHDLIEEIARLYGFNAIEPVMPAAPLRLPERDTRTRELRRACQLRGYNETVPLSLLGPDLLQKCHLRTEKLATIQNPIGEELSIMQPSVLPRLLEQAGDNISRADDAVRLFTVASVFGEHGDSHTEMGAVYAARRPTTLQTDPFLLLKRDVCDSLADIGYAPAVRSAKNPSGYAHPGRYAEITVQDTVIGTVLEVLPAVRSAFDLPERVSAVLLNLSALLQLEAATAVGQRIPQFPAIRYDETFSMDHTQQAQALIDKAAQSSNLLESVTVADLFDKEEASYNLTLRFTYRADDKTLKEEEVKKEHEKVLHALGMV